jgi:hypothetical protein
MVLFVLLHLLHPSSQIMLHVIFKSFFKKSSNILQGIQGSPGGSSTILTYHSAASRLKPSYAIKEALFTSSTLYRSVYIQVSIKEALFTLYSYRYLYIYTGTFCYCI